MPLALGLDLGTTTITALALDTETGEIVARQTTANDADVTAPDDRARGRSQWDAPRIAVAASDVLRSLALRLGSSANEAVGVGLTGQQHGVVLVDERLAPLGPFVNWQDRRAEETNPASGRTWLAEARAAVGRETGLRTGCTLSPGYMGVTLYWMAAQGLLPRRATACFLVDYFGAVLTGGRPVTDATSAASSGLLDVARLAWDEPSLEALNLPRSMFPDLRPAGTPLGRLTEEAARATGLPEGLNVCVGVGDNQASFYGSVAELSDTVLVNVGTGGQVAAYGEHFVVGEELEARPFPGGYLLVNAGLCGGRTYALWEQFFRQVAGLAAASPPLYDAMNRLAAGVPRGAGGLRCEPLFTGTRQDPTRRGGFTGISAENFTPAYFTRALLEGMAAIFRQGRDRIEATLGGGRARLVGAGNGIRENPVLSAIIADEFGMPLLVPYHREEAAFGAALLAGVGLGALADRRSAARLIRYRQVGV